MSISSKTIIYKNLSCVKTVEKIVKDGGNYVKKYVIINCKTEKVKVNSSGFYEFGDISLTKNERV